MKRGVTQTLESVSEEGSEFKEKTNQHGKVEGKWHFSVSRQNFFYFSLILRVFRPAVDEFTEALIIHKSD